MDGRTEILKDHDLSFRVAAGHGNNAGPQFFRAVMHAETAGEKAVTVGIMDDVVFGQSAATRQRAMSSDQVSISRLV